MACWLCHGFNDTDRQTSVTLCQVLPEYLKRSVGSLLTDPFVSACLPKVVAALQPRLSQLQPKAAELLNHIDVAARQSKQLGQVLQQASQVTSDQPPDTAAMHPNKMRQLFAELLDNMTTVFALIHVVLELDLLFCGPLSFQGPV